MELPKTVIFIGPQGSGKGTQARILQQKLNAEYLEAGEMFRRIATLDTPLGRTVKNITDKGLLADDETWRTVIASRLQDFDDSTPIIFDGSPRTLSQAHFLIDYLAAHHRDGIQSVWIKIPREESIKRLMSRRFCSICKTPATFVGDPAQMCEMCGGSLIKRNDETPEAISMRLKLYEEQTLPVIDYLRETTILHEIEGMPPVHAVAAEIDRALGISHLPPMRIQE